MLTPCQHCPAFDWCKQRGCIAWNDNSRERYFELKRRSDEQNRMIDELEEMISSLP